MTVYKGIIKKKRNEAISIYPAYDFYALETVGGESYRIILRNGDEKELQPLVGKAVTLTGTWPGYGWVLHVDSKADIVASKMSTKSFRPKM